MVYLDNDIIDPFSTFYDVQVLSCFLHVEKLACICF